MLIDNKNIVLKDILKKELDNADEVIICSPFISSNEILFNLLERDITTTIICRLAHPASPDFFEKLLPYLNDKKKVFVFDDNSLHAKIYLFKKRNKATCAIIGSSNFTDPGISTNREMNLLITNYLAKVQKYLSYLVENSYSNLSKAVIEYYRTFYRKPEVYRKYRKATINDNLMREYEAILNRFHIVKGLLEKYTTNITNLPFTYIFDSFCHQFKTRMINEYKLNKQETLTTRYLKKYFKTFLDSYFTEDDKKWRMERFKFCNQIRKNINKLSVYKLREFFWGIHSVSSGSGSGKRIMQIKKTNPRLLRKLLLFIIFGELSMAQKYALALTPRKKNGLKIDYVGPSTIGEIPGWLLPNNYPIKNDKYLYVLDFFNV